MVELWNVEGTENKTRVFDPSSPSPSSLPRRRRKLSSAGDSSDDNTPSVFLSPPGAYSSSPSSSSSSTPYDSFSNVSPVLHWPSQADLPSISLFSGILVCHHISHQCIFVTYCIYATPALYTFSCGYSTNRGIMVSLLGS